MNKIKSIHYNDTYIIYKRGKKKKEIVNINRLILLIIISIIMLIFVFNYENSYLCTYVMSWIINILFILRLIDCKKNEKSIFNKYSLFISVCYLYFFGRIFLFSFNLINLDNIIYKYDIELINKYLLFSAPSFYIFTMPIVLFRNSAIDKINMRMKKKDPLTQKSVTIICLFLLIISAPIYWLDMIDFVQTALLNGYGANFIHDKTSNSGIFGNVILLYVPSVVFLLVNTKKIFLKYIYLMMLIVPAIGYMFVGGRGPAMALLLCSTFLWMEEICRSRKKEKYLWLIILVGVLLLGFFSTLRELRVHSLTNPGEMLKIFFSNNIFEEAISTIKEIGSTMYTWIKVENIVPSVYNYKFGYSYISSILACIPSNLIGYSFADDAALDIWLTKVTGADYGLGFSMLAESYYNFGFLGILTIFFIGVFIFYFISGNFAKNVAVKYMNAVSAISIYIFTNTARNSLSLSVRYVFWGIVIPWILINLMKNILNKLTYVK